MADKKELYGYDEEDILTLEWQRGRMRDPGSVRCAGKRIYRP